MAYASVNALAMRLQKPQPTALELEGMQRALDEAAQEIDWELGYSAESPAPVPVPPLVVGVNIDRAAEHWRREQSAFGVVMVGTGVDTAPIVTARNSWYPHSLKLAPLKTQYGIA